MTPADTARKAEMVIGIAEYLLGERVRSILDVGCGEGAWYTALKKIRPRMYYMGIDPSPYVVERYGARRNLRLGAFDGIAEHAGDRMFDVIVCSDVLQYVPRAQLARGLGQVAENLRGVAFLEAHTSADAMTGDMRGWYRRTPAYYRRIFRKAGLTACGPHCYFGEALDDRVNALERLAE
jgi:SAM-dependent methyltransferase